MSDRELVVLGTASQAPTRHRNHNGYLLRWDGEGLLFDPGEGTQRQMLLAGVSPTQITRLCLTHFHGDHCLGVPGIVQRLALDRLAHPVFAHFPASGGEYFEHLRHASYFYDVLDLREEPVTADGVIARGEFGTLEARRLDHSIDAVGYRLIEPAARHFLPDRLAQAGVTGPMVGRLQADGQVWADGRWVGLADVSAVRRGQRFAFVMDTRLCDGVYELADGADLLVIEATFLDRDRALAADYGHLTARQAARVAAECGVRRLVLTHFSQRYPDLAEHRAEAQAAFDGDVVVAEDLMRVPVPPRSVGVRTA
ncbi:ribonuclease Z [Mycolicibacterium duvalii]|uniref:Ribonuclease Z n=1 Tax=Mycolicibacterium duvalii TaxID=39688 RepID=A0A7I7JWQ6_9MYCO|nr:ribonuclease Z [Mycolicibacterium duvalii]MCV7369539.1 ribonuclease Z [Mycolicibacterium duvalii]PEG42171.1 ribonuclease Z [Mycolicibacterium duvalii]BBX16260.1 ribonuclease Z [Mycolicibacterium duvalii]